MQSLSKDMLIICWKPSNLDSLNWNDCVPSTRWWSTISAMITTSLSITICKKNAKRQKREEMNKLLKSLEPCSPETNFPPIPVSYI
ncbi:unnamed protein product [Dicrocoelium dendriticum]|nr:unnamed protein product [Dicrocoelium dendriticum]